MHTIRALFLFLAFVSFSANAETYYWIVNNTSNVNFKVSSSVKHVSATAACQYYVDNFIPTSTLSGHSYTMVMAPTNNSASCYIHLLHTTNGVIKDFFTMPVTRFGTECPANSVYNPATGKCDGDPCLDKKDQDQRVSKSGIRNDGFVHCFKTTDGKTICSHATSACFNGCAVELPMGSGFKCTYDTAGQYRCSGSGYYSGTSCSSQVPSSDPDPDGNDPVPMEKSSDEPCIFGTVNGVTSCEQRNRIDFEGIFGGEGNCTGDACNPTKDATSKEDKTKTEITSTTDENGVTTTTKKETKTQTKCIGTDTDCSTSTTTKTTTTKTDGSGNTTSTTGTCTGPQCSSNTNPDADGDGFGDCVGDDCGEEEEASSVSGESCNVELSCEGDAIQCAILRQEKENNCKWRLGAEEESAITAAVSGEGFELEEKNIDGAALFNQAISQGRWLAASCPPPRSISVMGKTITFSWEPVCEFAIAMGPLIVALASLFFAVFVFRGVKGS